MSSPKSVSFRVDVSMAGMASAMGAFRCNGAAMASRSTKPSVSFGLDRLTTPIGIALLVTDAEGALRALDWEDYEHRMRELLRMHYGVVDLSDQPAPAAMRTALSGYFDGDLGQLSGIVWRIAGTTFQQKVWTALAQIPAGTTMSYGALAARIETPKAMRAVGHAKAARGADCVVDEGIGHSALSVHYAVNPGLVPGKHDLDAS